MCTKKFQSNARTQYGHNDKSQNQSRQPPQQTQKLSAPLPSPTRPENVEQGPYSEWHKRVCSMYHLSESDAKFQNMHPTGNSCTAPQFNLASGL